MEKLTKIKLKNHLYIKRWKKTYKPKNDSLNFFEIIGNALKP